MYEQMNLSAKLTHRHREKTCDCQGGVGKGRLGSLGLVEENYYI